MKKNSSFSLFFTNLKKIWKNLFSKKSEAKWPHEISERIDAHKKIKALLNKKKSPLVNQEIANYTLGHIDRFANFCAQKIRDDGENCAEKIKSLNPDWEEKVSTLVRELALIEKASSFQKMVEEINLKYLNVAIASEILMVLKPDQFTVINKRILFAFFKKYPQDPFLNLSNLQLKEKIISMHHRWPSYYPMVLSFMEKMALNIQGDDNSFKFFHAEKMVNDEYLADA